MENQSLKAFADDIMIRKSLCTIRFRAVDGGISIIKAHIISMHSVSGRDMFETDAGFVIALDQVLAINDKSFENYC